MTKMARRGVRVVEGARLEIVCTLKSRTEGSNPSLSAKIDLWWSCVGPLATRSCEPRQVRKEAAAAMDVCAGVWLARATTLYCIATFLSSYSQYGLSHKINHSMVEWVKNNRIFSPVFVSERTLIFRSLCPKQTHYNQ